MSNFLKRDNRIRYKNSTGELVLYNPTKEQYETLIEEMKSSVKINEEQQFEGVSSLTFLRYIYENFDNNAIIKGLSDVELKTLTPDFLENTIKYSIYTILTNKVGEYILIFPINRNIKMKLTNGCGQSYETNRYW